MNVQIRDFFRKVGVLLCECRGWGGGGGRTMIHLNNSMFNDIISTLKILKIADLSSLSRSTHSLQKSFMVKK